MKIQFILIPSLRFTFCRIKFFKEIKWSPHFILRGPKFKGTEFKGMINAENINKNINTGGTKNRDKKGEK